MPFFLLEPPPHCCFAAAARSGCLQPSLPLRISSALLSCLSCHLLAAEGGGREKRHRGRGLIFRGACARGWQRSAALASSSTSPPKVRGRKPRRGCLATSVRALWPGKCCWGLGGLFGGAGHAPLYPTNQGLHPAHCREEGTAAAGLGVTPSSARGRSEA